MTKRLPNGLNLHRFLEGYGVNVLPYAAARSSGPRPANTVYGGRYIARLLMQDPDRAGLVVRCIQVSNPRCFDADVVSAVWAIVSTHFANRPPKDAMDHFRAVDIGALKARGKMLATGAGGRMLKLPQVLASLLADRMLLPSGS